MKLCLILTLLGVITLIFYVKEKLKAYNITELILKSAVSVLFMATAVAAAFSAGMGSFGALVIVGLLLGLMGDVWLDLKFVYPDDDTVYTFAGFWSFAIGHVMFISALLINYADFSKPLFVIIPALLAVIGGVGNVFAGPIMKLEYGKFKGITMLYGSILFYMLLLAGSLALMNGWQCTTLNLMFFGGVAFAISDIVLSGTYFGVGKERPVDIILNYIFYYGAQFTIAFAILFA